MKQTYNLNLSPRYAPGWNAWEVAREVICNAIDADADGMRITPNGQDTISVWTPTVPDIAELFVIGQGSKSPGGNTIGQFGEGLKMAALVTTRTKGGSFKCLLPTSTVTFAFETVFGQEVLHAQIEDASNADGYEVVITMPGIANSFDGKILDSQENGPRPKREPDALNVYCKGVHICELPNIKSIWDWNLNDIAINRDRSMVSTYDIARRISDQLDFHLTPELIEGITANPDSLEGTQGLELTYNGESLKKIADGFRARYGENMVLMAADHATNEIARQNGYRPVPLPEITAKRLAGFIKSAEEVLPRNHDLESVDISKYAEQIARLRRLDDILAAPPFSLSIFASRSESLKGRADIDDVRIWLSESLFTSGNELELVRTYLHELGHICSSANDLTSDFEFALDGIAGRLAMKVYQLEAAL